MLTLSINPTNTPFGPSKTSQGASPTGSSRSQQLPARPQLSILSPSAPRRPLMPQNAKRPKLSLQTSILPQPVSPALPLSCGTDTPTTCNTLANSFRSPASALPKAGDKTPQLSGPSQQEDRPSLPYGVESARGSILKNTPLAKLIQARRQEKGARATRLRIAFVETPEVIPRPPQDAEPEYDEDEHVRESIDTPLPAADGGPEEAPAPSMAQSSPDAETTRPASRKQQLRHEQQQETSTERPRSDSTEWLRLRTERSANEGRELRRSSTTTVSSKPAPVATSAPSTASYQPSCDMNDSTYSRSSDSPPRTPETPSPANTRAWVWTLGDDFGQPPASADSPSTASSTSSGSGQGSRRPSNTPSTAASSEADCSALASMLNTPTSTTATTPITPNTPRSIALPGTPVKPGSVAADREGEAGGVLVQPWEEAVHY